MNNSIHKRRWQINRRCTIRALSAGGHKSEVGVTHHLFDCRRYRIDWGLSVECARQNCIFEKYVVVTIVTSWPSHLLERVSWGKPTGLAMPLVQAGNVDMLLTLECERTISKATVPPQFEHRKSNSQAAVL